MPPHVRKHWTIRESLTVEEGLVFFGKRVLVPAAARRNVLAKLHAAHQGIVRTKQRARHTVYWPGINNDIILLVEGYESCQSQRSSLPKEPLMRDSPPDFVFQVVSADLFQAGKLNVLVYSDRLSGWPVIHQWHHSPTAREVARAVIGNFVGLGVPVRIRTDGGPQFAAKEFQDALSRWGVTWSPTTPHFPQSNGHAEAAGKTIKALSLKAAPTGDLNNESFLQGLLEFRNTPNATGLSPA